MFHTFFEGQKPLSYKINFKNKLTRNDIFEKLFMHMLFYSRRMAETPVLNFCF